jgi:hypothetical protein
MEYKWTEFLIYAWAGYTKFPEHLTFDLMQEITIFLLLNPSTINYVKRITKSSHVLQAKYPKTQILLKFLKDQT